MSPRTDVPPGPDIRPPKLRIQGRPNWLSLVLLILIQSSGQPPAASPKYSDLRPPPLVLHRSRAGTEARTLLLSAPTGSGGAPRSSC